MDQINFGYSLKDIPLPDDKTFLQILIQAWEITDKAMRWRIKKFFHPEVFQNSGKENFGFKTSKPAPIPKPDCPSYQPLKDFQKGMAELIKDVKFNNHSNEHQEKLKKDVAKINKEKRMYVSADKTSNLYLVEPDQYRKLLQKSVHKEYKKSCEKNVLSDEKADLAMAKKLNIADRVHRTAKRDSFVTLKDHKAGFRSNPQCRLLNPTKPELGRVSKKILDRINSELRRKTNLRQWRRTQETRDWFVKLKQKHTMTFIKFDVEAMYPSISEELLASALQWARTLVEVTEEEVEVINATKKALLYSEGEPWTKKGEVSFDVPMGSFDGAEVCEAVGLYLLHLLKETGVDLGLYRDDLLGATRLTGRPLEKMRQKITTIFNENGLKVIGTVGLEATDFLDIFLDLRAGTYRSFVKDGDQPTYVHSQSNHPPTVLKNIGPGVNRRISLLNANQELFDQAAPVYQNALRRSKHSHHMEFSSDPHRPSPSGFNLEPTSSKKRRRRDVIYWNPPYSLNVETNIGGRFLALIDRCFPKGSIMSKVFNRSNLKLSYRTCLMMVTLVSSDRILANPF